MSSSDGSNAVGAWNPTPIEGDSTPFSPPSGAASPPPAPPSTPYLSRPVPGAPPAIVGTSVTLKPGDPLPASAATPPAADTSGGGGWMDVPKDLGAAALQGAGTTISAFGGLGQFLARPIVWGINKSFGDNTISDPVNPFKGAGDAVSGWGDSLRGTESAAAQAAGNAPVVEGDILHPSTWRLGPGASSPRAWLMHATNLVGQAVPMLAGGLEARGTALVPELAAKVAGGEALDAGELAAVRAATTAAGQRTLATGATIGGLQGAQGSADAERARILAMNPQDLAAVPGYQQRLASGMSPDQARSDLAESTSANAFAAALPVATAAGLAGATPFLRSTQEALMQQAGGSVLKRAAVGAGLEAPVQGALAMGQQAAQTAAANATTGENRSLTADSMGAFGSGAVAGGLFGGFGAVLHRNPYPTAAPGSLSDAANTLTRDAANAAAQRAAPAVGPEAQSLPPGQPWWLAGDEGAPASVPSRQELTEELADHMSQQYQDFGHMRVDPAQIARAWQVPQSEVQRNLRTAQQLAMAYIESAKNRAADESAAPQTPVDMEGGAAPEEAASIAPAAGAAAAPEDTGAQAPPSTPAAPEENPPAVPGASASVPFMITQANRAALRAAGLDDAAIAKLTPQMALDILNNPSEASPAEPSTPSNEPAPPRAPEQAAPPQSEMELTTPAAVASPDEAPAQAPSAVPRALPEGQPETPPADSMAADAQATGPVSTAEAEARPAQSAEQAQPTVDAARPVDAGDASRGAPASTGPIETGARTAQVPSEANSTQPMAPDAALPVAGQAADVGAGRVPQLPETPQTEPQKPASRALRATAAGSGGAGGGEAARGREVPKEAGGSEPVPRAEVPATEQQATAPQISSKQELAATRARRNAEAVATPGGNGREYVDHLIDQGYDTLQQRKEGAITRTYLTNARVDGVALKHAALREYARGALREREAAAPKSVESTQAVAPDRALPAADSAAPSAAPPDKQAAQRLENAAHDAQGVRVKTAAGEVNGREHVDQLIRAGYDRVESVGNGTKKELSMVNAAGDRVAIKPRQLRYAQEATARQDAGTPVEKAPAEKAATAATERPTAEVNAEQGARVPPSDLADIEALRNEIGWDQVGGRILRAVDEGGLSPDVVGRTTWVAKAGQGGALSKLWSDRPLEGGRINEKQAHAAIDKYARGEPLNKREQRFIDWARRVAKDYNDRYEEDKAQFERDQADMEDAAIVQARQELIDHGADFNPADDREALTLSQWVQRAHDASVPEDTIIDAVLDASFSKNPAQQAQTLSRAISDQEHRSNFDKENTDIRFSRRSLDDDYMAAVKRGDMETAQRIVDEAAAAAGYSSDDQHRMSHRAPNHEDDVSLADVRESGLVPNDYWTHPWLYQSDPQERAAFEKIRDLFRSMDARKAVGKQPGLARMTVYRAVPKDVREATIRNGDWVSPSEAYARLHGIGTNSGYRIIRQTVRAKDLWWDGNSAAELGYDDGNGYAYRNTRNNRKLLDTVTRDDDGNIIPPSKRFNARSDDVRYSRDNGTPSPEITSRETFPSGVPKGLPVESTPETVRLENRINQDVSGSGNAPAEIAAIPRAQLPDGLAGALDEFERFGGVRVEVIRSLNPEESGFDPNGVTLREGVLYVAESAQHPLTHIAAHEFLHQLRKDRPDLYGTLVDEWHAQGRKDDWLREAANRGYDPRFRDEEAVADGVGDALADPDFMERMAQRNPSAFSKLADAFKRFLDNLLAKMGSIRDLGSQRYWQDVQAFRDKLADVLDRYAREGINENQAQTLSRAISDQEHRNGLDAGTETVDRAGNAEKDQGGQAAPGSIAEEGTQYTLAGEDAKPSPGEVKQPEQPGLFKPPTNAERIAAERAAKDNQRNGLAGGKPDTGEGGLFDGARPEQARIPDSGMQVNASSRDMFTRTRAEMEASDGKEQAGDGRRDGDSGPSSATGMDAGSLRLRPDATPELTRRSEHQIDEIVRGFGGSVLADTIARDFKEKGSAQLVGQVARSIEDFAALAQVYRNPYFETLHYVFVDDAGRVVGESAVSARHASSSDAFPEGQDAAWLRRTAEGYGATGIWMTHNHPSGNPTPSGADINLTRYLAQEDLGGARLLGHVVLDHTIYNTISTDGFVNEGRLAVRGDDPNKNQRGLIIDSAIKSTRDAAVVGRQIADHLPSNSIAIMAVDAKGKVTTATSLPVDVLGRKDIVTLLKRIAYAGRAHGLVMAGPDRLISGKYGDVVKGLMKGRVLLDVASTSDDGRAARSLVESGVSGGYIGKRPGEYARAAQIFEDRTPFHTDDRGQPEEPGKPRAPFAQAAQSIEQLHAQLPKVDSGAFQHVKDWLAGKAVDLEPKALGALNLRHVLELASGVDVLGKPARGYAELFQRMDGERNTMTQEGAAKADDLRRWAFAPGPAGWLGKLRPEAKALFRFMHDVTQLGVDPLNDYQRLLIPNGKGDQVPWTRDLLKERIQVLRKQKLGRSGDDARHIFDEIKFLQSLPQREKIRAARYPEMVARWNALTPEAQAQFRVMRDHYEDVSRQLFQAASDRVMALDIPRQNKLAMVAQLKDRFESSRVEGTYFPLQRFGDFWLSGTSKDGEYFFAKYENAAAATQAEKALKAAGATIEAVGRQDNDYRARSAPSGTFISEIMDSLKKNGAPDKVQDDIYQMFLKTLPELSLQKSGIHRKNIAGYTDDVPRVFSSNIFHAAHQIAKARYGYRLQDTVDTMKGLLDVRRSSMDVREAAHADALHAEIVRRNDWVMNPTNNKLANMATSIGFMYHLAASPASALVNLIQMPQIVLPVLGAQHGWAKASRELGRAMRDAVRTGGHIERTLTTDEDRQAFKALQQQGTFQRTASHTLAGLAEGGALRASPVYAKTMNALSWMFHTSEVVNREATGMAAFRLARAKGMDFNAALRYADEMTNGTHGDYSNANRARYMQGNVSKVLFQFKNYSLAMSWLWGRNFYKAFKGETPEVRALARRTVTGLLGMTGLFAGVVGMPIFNALRYTANAVHAVSSDDDTPWDFETEFRAWLAEHLGAPVADVVADGVADKVTGAQISHRVSMSDLWFRDTDRQLEGQAWYDNFLESLAGPVGGVMKNLLVGAQQFNEGHTERGIETMLPNFAKNAMKAVRFAAQGANNLRGDPIVSDVSTPAALLQAIGFTPTSVGDQQRINNALMTYQTAIQDRRQTLMNAFAMARIAGDDEAARTAVEKIQAFNQKYPEIRIGMANLHESLRMREKRSAQSEGGIQLNRKLAGRLRDAVGVPASP